MCGCMGQNTVFEVINNAREFNLHQSFLCMHKFIHFMSLQNQNEHMYHHRRHLQSFTVAAAAASAATTTSIKTYTHNENENFLIEFF